jgi:hypothetical protein
VGDNSLAQCLFDIRRALNDDSQQLIRTVARRGYVFAASVITEVETPRARAAASTGTLPLPVPHTGRQGSLWRWFGAALLPVLSVAAFFGWRSWRVSENTEPLRAVPLTTLPGVARYPSLSPAGNFVALWTARTTPISTCNRSAPALPSG